MELDPNQELKAMRSSRAIHIQNMHELEKVIVQTHENIHGIKSSIDKIEAGILRVSKQCFINNITQSTLIFLVLISLCFISGCEHDGITKRSCDPTYETIYNKADCNEYLKRTGMHWMVQAEDE